MLCIADIFPSLTSTQVVLVPCWVARLCRRSCHPNFPRGEESPLGQQSKKKKKKKKIRYVILLTENTETTCYALMETVPLAHFDTTSTHVVLVPCWVARLCCRSCHPNFPWGGGGWGGGGGGRIPIGTTK